MAKLKACISIDVDTLSSIYKGVGCTRPGGYTFIEFRTGMENLASFFKRYDIETTLFMVGNDFLHKANLGHIQAVHQAGHEIANHSMTHPQGFRWLSNAEKEYEIRSMGQVCQDCIGEQPIGFRSPGWNNDDSAIPVLKKCKYQYDSSVFPTFLMPIMKIAHWHSMSKREKHERTTMGSLVYMFAPIQPYRTSSQSLGKKGEDGLLEFPISVSPVLRIPFFATQLLFSGMKFNQLLYKSMRFAQHSIHFQMHLSDFVDYSLPELADQMPRNGQGSYIPQALHTPLSKKLDVFARIIELIALDYDFYTLKQWAQVFNTKK